MIDPGAAVVAGRLTAAEAAPLTINRLIAEPIRGKANPEMTEKKAHKRQI